MELMEDPEIDDYHSLEIAKISEVNLHQHEVNLNKAILGNLISNCKMHLFDKNYRVISLSGFEYEGIEFIRKVAKIKLSLKLRELNIKYNKDSKAIIKKLVEC
jgi:hypothetical protein